MTEIYCKFEWQEKTQTFLLILKPSKAPNFRTNLELEQTHPVKEVNGHWELNLDDWTEFYPLQTFEGNPLRYKNKDTVYCFFRPHWLNVKNLESTWAPSWIELGNIMEVLRFTDYLNSWKIPIKTEFKILIGNSWRTLDQILKEPWFDYKIGRGQ